MRALATVCILIYLPGFSQKTVTPIRQLDWQGIVESKLTEENIQHFLTFSGAGITPEKLPEYFERVKVSPNAVGLTTTLANTVYADLSADESALVKSITGEIKINSSIGYDRKVPIGLVHFVPIRRNSISGKLEKLISFSLEFNESSTAQAKFLSSAKKNYATNSVLATGKWFKIGLTKDGIYKLSYSFLQQMGLDLSADPRHLRIYGNGGGQLPYANATFRRDDLTENAILVQGENDGQLDPQDYVLFYGQGPTRWTYKPSACPTFQHALNLYSDTTYYFITTDLGIGKRIIQQPSLSSATTSISTFDDYAFTEDETSCLIKSGREWYGFNFDILSSVNLSYYFPDIDASAPATVKVDLIGRYKTDNTYVITCGSSSKTISAPYVVTSDYESTFASAASGCLNVNNPSSSINVSISKQVSGAEAWLNYVEVNARRFLNMKGDQMHFRDSKSIGVGNRGEFNLSVGANVQAWEVSDPTNVRVQGATTTNGLMQFTVATDSLREFIAFNGNTFYTPAFFGTVANQNLHGLNQADMIIVTNPLFMNEATALASFHQSKDNLSIALVTPQQIYNEFSSGAQDVSAIRDFVKMFYDRSTGYTDLPKYLLLFGDGSYDNKHRVSSNTNFIPTYQSANSVSPTSSYVSDDFYGLLDDNEGDWGPNASDMLDIGIGRLPADYVYQAQAMVNKIIRYETKGGTTVAQSTSCNNGESNSTYGDWRNVMCFIGDDEDWCLHTEDADKLASYVNANYKDVNLDKIYFDATVQEATPGGNRYPLATEAINKRVTKGALIVNYSGHGGQFGLAHERVVEISDIEAWSNAYQLPLFFTATCEFSRFDDPAQTSAGEDVLLNPTGGGIALMSTVRLVLEGPNYTLNLNFYKHLYDPLPNGEKPRLGDLYRYAKVWSGPEINNRNFTLLGDPAVRLAYPEYYVVTDSINNKKVSGVLDTVRALSVFTIGGHLADKSGNLLTGYNGFIYPTVYDKPTKVNTLLNDGSASSPLKNNTPFTFLEQKNILYKGKVSVTNGYYHFSFIVPKDIAYQYGLGRISYYAENGSADAAGHFENFFIGGSSASAKADATGPDVKLYMNDTKFVFGGTTNENPVLYAIVKDSSGINTVGNGIGHDLLASIDGNSQKTTLLNDYYQADLNSFRSGTIRYPFHNLSEGKHVLSLKVWDVYNNSSQVTTEFVVANNAVLALKHVLNYPNPFTTSTKFYFENNRCCEQLDVQIQVFTVSGKLVKSINSKVTAEGFRPDPIEWDGKDDFGDQIGRGVYVYHLKVKSADGNTADKFEKLVILN